MSKPKPKQISPVALIRLCSHLRERCMPFDFIEDNGRGQAALVLTQDGHTGLAFLQTGELVLLGAAGDVVLLRVSRRYMRSPRRICNQIMRFCEERLFPTCSQIVKEAGGRS